MRVPILRYICFATETLRSQLRISFAYNPILVYLNLSFYYCSTHQVYPMALAATLSTTNLPQHLFAYCAGEREREREYAPKLTSAFKFPNSSLAPFFQFLITSSQSATAVVLSAIRVTPSATAVTQSVIRVERSAKAVALSAIKVRPSAIAVVLSATTVTQSAIRVERSATAVVLSAIAESYFSLLFLLFDIKRSSDGALGTPPACFLFINHKN